MKPLATVITFVASVTLGAAWLFGSASNATAYPNYYTTWNNVYPTSTTDNNIINGTGSSCALCHFTTNGGSNYNPYGWRIRQNLNAGQSVSQSIQNAGPFNSDNDPTGSINTVEIGANSQPGWTVGPNNTRYSNSGSTTTGQMPLSGIQGSLDPCGTGTTYCTAGTTSNGCVPAISMVGTANASFSGTCDIVVNNVEGAKQGLIFYGFTRNASSWGTSSSFLCVKAPTQRTSNSSAGGTNGQCDGQLSIDIHAW